MFFFSNLRDGLADRPLDLVVLRVESGQPEESDDPEDPEDDEDLDEVEDAETAQLTKGAPPISETMAGIIVATIKLSVACKETPRQISTRVGRWP